MKHRGRRGRKRRGGEGQKVGEEVKGKGEEKGGASGKKAPGLAEAWW